VHYSQREVGFLIDRSAALIIAMCIMKAKDWRTIFNQRLRNAELAAGPAMAAAILLVAPLSK